MHLNYAKSKSDKMRELSDMIFVPQTQEPIGYCFFFLADPLKFKQHPTDEPKEVWGYVDVRPSAHMFYWLYYTTNIGGYKNSPLVMWLQVCMF